jgi:CSLREA domain-containing protein
MTERWDVNSATGGDDEETLLAAADEILAASGPTGSRTATTAANNGWVAHSVIVNPATGTLTVNSTADVVDQTPGDGSCDTGGTVGADPECTLRAAIQESNALAGAQTIVVPAGTYTLSITGAGEDGSVTGDLDVNGDVTITGAGSGLVTLDANSIDRMFEIRSGNLNLSGITVTGGSLGSLGAGIFVDAGRTLTMNDVVVTANSSTSNGGGIYVEGTLVATDSTISNNTSTNAAGGLYGAGGSSITLDRVAVTGNTASSLGVASRRSRPWWSPIR